MYIMERFSVPDTERGLRSQKTNKVGYSIPDLTNKIMITFDNFVRPVST